MKTSLCLLVAAALLHATPGFAAKGGKGGKGGNTAAPATTSSTPSVELRSLIDNTLPKISNISGPNVRPIDRAKLIEVQADFTAKAQVAPPAQQPMYVAAQRVATNLVGAVEEYEKAVADFRYSQNTHGKQDREDSKVSNPRRGWDAGALARADNAKQKMENDASRQALLDKEKFMSNGAIATWSQRVGQIHNAVEQSYATELVAEKQLAMLTPPAPPVRVTAPPRPKPSTPPPAQSSAATAYSPAGTWTSAKGQWYLTDDGKFTTPNGYKGTWEWGNRAKRELSLTWKKSGNTGKGVFSADGKTLQVTSPTVGESTLTR